VCFFSALTLLVGSFDPQKPVPDMTYIVFGGTISLTQSIMVHVGLFIVSCTVCGQFIISIDSSW